MYSILYPYLPLDKCKKSEKHIIKMQICIYLNYKTKICSLDNKECIAFKKGELNEL